MFEVAHDQLRLGAFNLSLTVCQLGPSSQEVWVDFEVTSKEFIPDLACM